jgi:hypothetical protein
MSRYVGAVLACLAVAGAGLSVQGAGGQGELPPPIGLVERAAGPASSGFARDVRRARLSGGAFAAEGGRKAGLEDRTGRPAPDGDGAAAGSETPPAEPGGDDADDHDEPDDGSPGRGED